VLVVVCGFVLFRADTLGQGVAMIGAMFAGWTLAPASQALLAEVATPSFYLAMGVAVLAATPVVNWARRKVKALPRLAPLFEPAGYVASVALFVLCVLALSASSYNPFIYFRF